MKKITIIEYSLIAIVSIIILFTLYINFFTKFKKNIVIKNIVNNYKSGKHGVNLINDTDGNVYVIQNAFLQGFFTGPELYSSLQEGKKYEVNGFGYRIPIIGMYPHITYAKELK